MGDLADYHGYPQFVATSLGLTLTNAACPGETSASFLNVTAPDDGCHEGRTAKPIPLPLFVAYSSTSQSQLDYAVAFLRANLKTGLVTITIGGDDLLLLEAQCTTPSATASQIETCELAGLGKVLAAFARNLTAIYLAIRFEARYQGPIVLATYFSPDYTNLVEDLAIGELNTVAFGLTAAFGGRVADVFTTFEHASVPAGGLPCEITPTALAFLNTVPPGGCGDHPTVAGQQLIANLVVQAVK